MHSGVVYKPSAVNPNLRVPEGEEAATNSEGAVCNHDQTELLETSRVHAVSARFEAWIAPTRTWRALAVFVVFKCTFSSLCAKSFVPRADLTCRAVLLKTQRVVANPNV